MSSDIQNSAYVLRSTPTWCHPYIKLARLDRPIGIWLLLFPCWWGVLLACGGFTHINFLILSCFARFAAGAIVMRGAGCVVNDLWDRNLDGAVERTRDRPLPAGKITVQNAFLFLGALLLTGFFILISFNTLTIELGIFSLVLVALYPLMKRITWWPQLFLGFTFNWGALMAWAAVTGSLSFPAIMLYIGGIFWTLAYDTIYAHQDKEDDALAGIKSTARLFGSDSRRYVAGFFALSILLLAVAKFASGQSGGTMLLIALPAMQAAWQLARWRMDDTANCLRIFKSNRFFGWLTLVSFLK